MKLTYDPEANVAYIRFKKKAGHVRTVVISDELNVDVAADGSIYGIELLNANAQLGLQKRKKLVIKNGKSGKSVEMLMSA